MYDNTQKSENAILVGVCRNLADKLADTTPESMRELSCLAETAGAEVLGEITQNRESPDNATFVGEGKLSEIADAAASLDANLVIFDDELTGSQLKNIENALGDGVRVIDRSALILDIFAARALSGEGKLQVELAQLKYNLPRLSGGYSSLSRLGGGIGTRGPGETKIETDRRYIRSRIGALERELDSLKRHRELIRRGRRKREIKVAALVGYTNSGKSTLLNKLTGSDVQAADMLFATLDPTTRAYTLPDGREISLVDTVGFIRKLPHHLIEAFKSTLEEAVLADTLIHVIDSVSDERENQIKVVENLLSELGCAGKPMISVFNKTDECRDFLPRPSYPEKSVFISAKNGDGLSEFAELLCDTVPGKRHEMTILVPYSDTAIITDMRKNDSIVSEDFTPRGTLLHIMADEKAYKEYKKYLYE